MRATRAGAALACTALACWAGAAQASAPVQGLIVQLRDAPEHLRVTPGDTSAVQLDPQAQAAALTQARHWATLLQRTGLAREAHLSLQAVGRAAHRLAWPQGMTATQQARWQAVLAAQPEVAWVVPDSREAPLQTLPPTPDDPLFAGQEQQWWLQPVSGSNSLPLAARLRGVAGVQAGWGWGWSLGEPGPVVAVLDTGLSAHPDLAVQRLLPGYDMVADWSAARGLGYANDGDGRDADPADPGDWVDAADQQADAGRYADCARQASSWHGTSVTGVIAAQSDNALGVAGANWGVRILPVRVAGKCGASVADIVDGMRWAAGLSVCRRWAASQDPGAGCTEWAPFNPNPARIVNISFGAAAACNAAYQAAVDELWALGVLVVAAAGNDSAGPSRPANCTQVLGVASVNRDGFKASYSNFGAALALATPGGDSGGRWAAWLADGGLLSLGNGGATVPGEPIYQRHIGTSFAAPVVSSVAAQMLSLAPALGAAELWAGLQASARPHVQSRWLAACTAQNPGRCACSTQTCGAGLLDASEALRYASQSALGLAYQAPAWPLVEIDTDELRLAVALGQDRDAPASGGDGSGDGTGDSAGSSGGGAWGAWACFWLVCAAGMLRAPKRRAASALRAG